jgi:hypothetical protein
MVLILFAFVQGISTWPALLDHGNLLISPLGLLCLLRVLFSDPIVFRTNYPRYKKLLVLQSQLSSEEKVGLELS